jgi:hypothetical protein
MSNTKLDEFKGEIEEYLGKKTVFESKIKRLKIKTCLNSAGIVKKDGLFDLEIFCYGE